MKGLEVGDSVYIKGEITEVNPNDTYTVEHTTTVHTRTGDSSGYVVAMIPTAEVVSRGGEVEYAKLELLAKLGLAFKNDTLVVHVLLSCGREDGPEMKQVQERRMEIATKIDEFAGELGIK